jgi:integrase
MMTTAAQEPKVNYWEELSKVAGALASNYSKLLKHNGKVYGNVIDGGHLWSSEYTITINPELSDREDITRLEPIDSYLAQNLLVNLAAEFPEFSKIRDWREITKDNITPDMMNILRMVTHRKVFSESCEVSQSWEHSRDGNITDEALNTFLSLYPEGGTHDFYECYLFKSFPPLSLMSTTDEISKFILYDCGRKGKDGISTITKGGRKAYFRAIRAFFNWAYSADSNLGLQQSGNPIQARWAKKLLAKLKDDKIMPAQDAKSIRSIFSHIDNLRNAAIVATYIESGGRLGDVARITTEAILWDEERIEVWDEKLTMTSSCLSGRSRRI